MPDGEADAGRLGSGNRLMPGADGTLRAVLAEVHDTCGDRHACLCRHADAAPSPALTRSRV